MSAEEVSRRYGLSFNKRGWQRSGNIDEPFEILDPPGTELLAAIECRGRRWTRGGRLHHITGHANKPKASASHPSLPPDVRQHYNVGLGDGMNDLDFLSCVESCCHPIEDSFELRSALPHARVTALPARKAGTGRFWRFSSSIQNGGMGLQGARLSKQFHRCFQAAAFRLFGLPGVLLSRRRFHDLLPPNPGPERLPAWHAYYRMKEARNTFLAKSDNRLPQRP